MKKLPYCFPQLNVNLICVSDVLSPFLSSNCQCLIIYVLLGLRLCQMWSQLSFTYWLEIYMFFIWLVISLGKYLFKQFGHLLTGLFIFIAIEHFSYMLWILFFGGNKWRINIFSYSIVSHDLPFIYYLLCCELIEFEGGNKVYCKI